MKEMPQAAALNFLEAATCYAWSIQVPLQMLREKKKLTSQDQSISCNLPACSGFMWFPTYMMIFFFTMNLKQCIVKKHAGTSVMTTEEVLEFAHDKG